MKEQFVPYELALKLKELGFDNPCFGAYNESDNNKFMIAPQLSSYEINTGRNSDKTSINVVTAPLWQQAFDWFRERYDLLGYINDESSIDDNVNIHNKWMWVIQELPIVLHDDLYDNIIHKSYEEARLACLEKLIEMCDEKS